MSRIRLSFPIMALLPIAWGSVCLAPAQGAVAPYTWKSVVIDGGGFVDGIVCHPTAQNVIYARTDVGGAYRWNQATNSWEQMFNWIPSSMSNAIGIESIAIDPANANIVYAVGGTYGAGTFFSSQNQGHTWSSYSLPFVVGANNYGRQNGERLMVDPNDPAILYYGSIQGGLYKSTNYGQAWSQVTSFPVTTTSDGVGIPLVQFIKSSGSNGNPTPTIFVGVSQTGNNLYESTNAGSTWNPVYSSSTLMPARASQDGLGNMYMTYNNGVDPNGISGGAVIKLNLSTLTASTVLVDTGYPYGFGSVSVSAQNPNEVIASTIDRWWHHDGLFLSTDGGSTWTDTSTNATVDVSLSPYIGTYDPLGSWDGSAQIDPFNSNRVFFGTGGGTTIVTNLTSSSATYTFNSVGMEEMGTEGLGVPSTGGALYMVFGDIGGFVDTNLTVSPPTSQQFSPGLGTINSMDFAELNPGALAVLTSGNSSYPDDGGFATNGISFNAFSAEPSGMNTGWPGNIAVSSQGDYMVWTPGGYAQYYSTNHGASWAPSSGGGGFASFFSCPAVSDRVTDGVFYAYDLSDGNFLRSTNGGASFSVVSSGALPTWNSNALYTVPGIAGDIWFPTTVGLYHSTNGGSSWTEVNTGNIQSIGFGKAASGSSYPTIFACGTLTSGATTNGLYLSTNEGASWTEIDDPLDEWGEVGLIKGDPNIYGRVYFGAGGFGLKYGDMAPNMPVNGTYPITNLNSGMVLDNLSSMNSNAAIVQEQYDGVANQQWQVTNLGNGQVEIINACSGMALTASGSTDGSGIVQSPWVDAADQIWTPSLRSNGYYCLTNVGSGLVLDDPGWSSTAGTAMDQWDLNYGSNQQWAISAIPPSTTATLAGDAGTSPWYVSSVTASLSAAATSLPVAATYYTIDGGAQQTYSAPFTISGDGTHTLKYWSVDNGGNSETAHTQQIDIDTTPPTTTASVSGATVTLMATDATSGLAATYYTIDGGATQTYSAPFSVSAGGSHTVTFFSTDLASNTETAKSTSVNANAPDTAQYNFESGVQGWTSSGAPIDSIAASASQAYLGLQGLAINFNGAAAGNSGIFVSTPAVPGGATVTFHVWVPAGNQISAVQPYIQDANWGWTGNWQYGPGLTQNAWNTITLTVPANAALPLNYMGIQFSTGAAWTGTCYVDSISWPAPSTTTDSLSGTVGQNGWYISPVSVTLTATAGTNPAAATYYTVDGGAKQTYTTPFNVSGDGTHAVSYWSVDTAGTEETAHAQTIKIDGTAPMTTLSGVTAGSTVAGPVTITLAATDSLSGVASTTYTIDGGASQAYSAPFSVSAGGSHTVAYFSTDRAGNIEATKSVTFTIGAASVTDVSGQITVTLGGYRYNPGTHLYGQSVTLTNNGASIVGPISLVLTNLTSNVVLSNASGTTSAFAPSGRPYVNAAGLANGSSESVALEFTDNAKVAISYATQVLAGSGSR